MLQKVMRKLCEGIRETENEAMLTKYARLAFDTFRTDRISNRSLSLVVADTVGRHAKRKGVGEKEVTEWLKGAYGNVWVRATQMRQGVDLKEILKVILARLQGKPLPKFVKKSLEKDSASSS